MLFTCHVLKNCCVGSSVALCWFLELLFKRIKISHLAQGTPDTATRKHMAAVAGVESEIVHGDRTTPEVQGIKKCCR